MKVAMIGQKGIPSRAGGVEIHVEEIAKRMIKDGYQVTVYCRKTYCEERMYIHEGVILKYIPTINTKSLDAIIYTFLATMHALISGVKVFHYHALGPSTLAFIPKLFGKKVICTVHGLDWKREKWGKLAKNYLKFGEYVTAKVPDETIVVGKPLVDYYKDKYNRDVTYIPNGVDIPEIREAQIITKKYNLKKDDYILFLARLVPEKGAHYLIEAFKYLKTDKKLVIAGGSSHSNDYVKKLKKMGEHENIIFTGFITGRELEELYSNAYIYVLPSEIEGLPISLLEAMSYSNCCLVSNIPENDTVLKEYGYSFKNKNVNDLKKTIEYLLNNNGEVLKIKKISQNYIKKKYNWEYIVKNLKEVYTKF
jgi:glycosyltransferase involved in cell wall biosynthesis